MRRCNCITHSHKRWLARVVGGTANILLKMRESLLHCTPLQASAGERAAEFRAVGRAGRRAGGAQKAKVAISS